MKTITVRTTWSQQTTLEVPDDFDESLEFEELPDELLDQITSQTADLTDWEVVRR